jgi:hypothetical protein
LNNYISNTQDNPSDNIKTELAYEDVEDDLDDDLDISNIKDEAPTGGLEDLLKALLDD